jgi:hypothetical protein
VEHPKGASLEWALDLPANIRLGWKGLPGTNTLAYNKNLYITAIKSFIVQGPASNRQRKTVKNVVFLVSGA